MYNSLTRLQNVFGFFTSVAFAVGAIIAASDLLSPRTPTGVITPTNVQVVKGRPHYYSTKKEEYAIIKFSLDADLSSLFTWNTKQLFVYVTAEWPSSSAAGGTNETNKAVIWDSIITSPSADHLSNLGPATLKKLRRATAGRTVDPSRGLLRLQNQRPKYQITHPTGRVAETSDDVRLRLHYNVQPWVGVLTWDHRDTDYGLWRAIDGADSDSFALPPLKKKDDESAKKTKKAKNT